MRTGVLLLTIFAFLISAVFSNSTGAPDLVCKDLKPQHGVEGQTSPPPYRLVGSDTVKSGDSISITLEGNDFKGFVLQARDTSNKAIGEFKIVDQNISQLLKCGGPNTVTHKKITSPTKRVEFVFIAPRDYKGAIKIVGTVAESGFVFWVQKVVKTIQVE